MTRIFFSPGRSFFLLCLLFIFSCRKGDTGTDPGHKPDVGNHVEQPVGQPIDDAYTEFIGVEGGTVKSPDGQVAITIPEGALSEETEIGIQTLTNTTPGGIGFGYRLTPHGTAFKKKVSVTFSYKNVAGRISSSKALEIAYQNEKGVWTSVGKAQKDPVKKTITIQTDHFSDWALVASMELSPVVKTLSLNETVTLKALRYIHEMDDDLLVPLGYPEAGTGEPKLIEQGYVVRWTLNGPGQLQAKGNEAVYKAPSSVGAQRTATITLELNIKGAQVLLISTILLVDGSIDISIDGGPWKTYAGIATKTPGLSRFSLGNTRTSADLPQIIFFWPATSQRSDGIYSWSQFGHENTNVVFQYVTPDLQQIYTSVFEEENHDVRDSGGFIQVEEVEENGKKYIKGMFAIDQSGIYGRETAEQIRVGKAMGIFKVLRTW
ncbi:MAG TPA: hypothetical protein VGN63_10880 [Flavisolibacter sp.]|jgi:hypothetical protein|nr:hypothetical protein [Flavisolibacter sp.]